MQDAAYIFQELGEKYNWSVSVLTQNSYSYLLRVPVACYKLLLVII